ncbi:unnamed protein product, partial [Mesorhabditis spiculigera]
MGYPSLQHVVLVAGLAAVIWWYFYMGPAAGGAPPNRRPTTTASTKKKKDKKSKSTKHSTCKPSKKKSKDSKRKVRAPLTPEKKRALASKEQAPQPQPSDTDLNTAKAVSPRQSTVDTPDLIAKVSKDDQGYGSMCYCRDAAHRNTYDPEQAKFNPALIYQMTATKLGPMRYEAYKAKEIHMYQGEKGSQLCEAARGEEKLPDIGQSYLTALEPILHALEYGDRHAALIDDLIRNYDYLETS